VSANECWKFGGGGEVDEGGGSIISHNKSLGRRHVFGSVGRNFVVAVIVRSERLSKQKSCVRLRGGVKIQRLQLATVAFTVARLPKNIVCRK
jgi:hypothetical protein